MVKVTQYFQIQLRIYVCVDVSRWTHIGSWGSVVQWLDISATGLTTDDGDAEVSTPRGNSAQGRGQGGVLARCHGPGVVPEIVAGSETMLAE